MPANFSAFDLTSLLKDWGVTLTVLAVAATAFSILFVLSLREFFFWFLRINKILKNQERIMRHMRALEEKLKAKPEQPADIKTQAHFPVGTDLELIKEKREPAKPETFKLLS